MTLKSRRILSARMPRMPLNRDVQPRLEDVPVQGPAKRAALSSTTGLLTGTAGGLLGTQLLDIGDLLHQGVVGQIVFGAIVVAFLVCGAFTAYAKAKYD